MLYIWLFIVLFAAGCSFRRPPIPAASPTHELLHDTQSTLGRSTLIVTGIECETCSQVVLDLLSTVFDAVHYAHAYDTTQETPRTIYGICSPPRFTLSYQALAQLLASEGFALTNFESTLQGSFCCINGNRLFIASTGHEYRVAAQPYIPLAPSQETWSAFKHEQEIIVYGIMWHDTQSSCYWLCPCSSWPLTNRASAG